MNYPRAILSYPPSSHKVEDVAGQVRQFMLTQRLLVADSGLRKDVTENYQDLAAKAITLAHEQEPDTLWHEVWTCMADDLARCGLVAAVVSDVDEDYDPLEQFGGVDAPAGWYPGCGR